MKNPFSIVFGRNTDNMIHRVEDIDVIVDDFLEGDDSSPVYLIFKYYIYPLENEPPQKVDRWLAVRMSFIYKVLTDYFLTDWNPIRLKCG